MQLIVHPGAVPWVPSPEDQLLLQLQFPDPGQVLHLHPRSEVDRVHGRASPRYAFRAFTRGGVSHVFVDETETPESIAWLSAHELTHSALRHEPALREELQEHRPEGLSPSGDAFHELDPEELYADQVATDLFGVRLDRAWWRARAPVQETRDTYGATDPLGLSGEQVLDLRRQGIAAVARVAGRTPGDFVPAPGGIEALHEEILGVAPRDWADLLTGIAWVESQGDTLAVSETGALGLMQLTKFVYGEEPAINPFRWKAAVQRSLLLMDRFLRRATREGGAHHDPVVSALMAYKEGWVGAQREGRRQRGLAYAEEVIRAVEVIDGTW